MRWIMRVISGIASTAPTYDDGGSTRSQAMSSVYSRVSASASSRQSCPVSVARSSSGSSTSVMFWT